MMKLAGLTSQFTFDHTRFYYIYSLLNYSMASRDHNAVTAGRGDSPRTSRQASAPTTQRTTRQASAPIRGSERRREAGRRSRSGSRRQGVGQGGSGGGGGDRPRTVEDSNEEAVFLEQLQVWAQETSRKQLTDLEAEFERLQSQPRPEPSAEFVR